MTTSTALAPTASAPPLADDGPAPGATRSGEVLVALRCPADLTTSLVRAAARARATDRPLCVVVVEPVRRRPLGAAPFVARSSRRRELASLTRAARALCALAGVELRAVVVLRPSWAWTRDARERDVQRRLADVASARRAELQPARAAGALRTDAR